MSLMSGFSQHELELGSSLHATLALENVSILINDTTIVEVKRKSFFQVRGCLEIF